ncbi:hypothetical protein COCOBI_17-1300 [Coccomyxa sp. Obi]|nr:hypothetical protein COCOBI_17-1300 [Coccomyxa sp. Obi]
MTGGNLPGSLCFTLSEIDEEMQQQPPKSVSMSAQPLVTLETVHRLQAHLVPQLIPCLPALSQSPNLSSRSEGSPVSDKGAAAKTQKKLVPPFRIGKPRGADRRLRQSKMEDFAVSRKTCKGAGQIFAQSLAPSSFATVPEAEMVAEKPKFELESQLSTAIIEQLTLQEDKWREIWNSPDKQLEEMMKAPALPFVRNLDMDFLRAIF